MRRKKIISLMVLISTMMSVYGQHAAQVPCYFEVGKPCPDLTLKNIEYYSKKQTTVKELLNDNQGKWLFIDMFDKNCGSCIAAFPGYNAIQKKYKDKMQFMLIGFQDKENQMSKVYARYRKQGNFIFPISIDSTIFFHQDLTGSPNLIIIDPHGITQYVTTYLTESGKVEDEDKIIQDILAGKHPILRKRYRDHEKEQNIQINDSIPFLTYNNGGTDTSFLYRSLLSAWVPGIHRGGYTLLSAFENPEILRQSHYKIEIFGISIEQLYQYAYIDDKEADQYSAFGGALYSKIWPEIIFETQDRSFLKTDLATGKNLYNYSLIVPPSKYKQHYLMRVIQNDLKNYFGYDAAWEIRKMPYWQLIATDKARLNLKTKGGLPYSPIPKHGTYLDSIVIKNYPVSKVLLTLLYYVQTKMPVIDETGIEGNIDITLKNIEIIGDISSIKKSLQKNGLDLIQREKEMKVLVISDPKPDTVMMNTTKVN